MELSERAAAILEHLDAEPGYVLHLAGDVPDDERESIITEHDEAIAELREAMWPVEGMLVTPAELGVPPTRPGEPVSGPRLVGVLAVAVIPGAERPDGLRWPTPMQFVERHLDRLPEDPGDLQPGNGAALTLAGEVLAVWSLQLGARMNGALARMLGEGASLPLDAPEISALSGRRAALERARARLVAYESQTVFAYDPALSERANAIRTRLEAQCAYAVVLRDDAPADARDALVDEHAAAVEELQAGGFPVESTTVDGVDARGPVLVTSVVPGALLPDGRLWPGPVQLVDDALADLPSDPAFASARDLDGLVATHQVLAIWAAQTKARTREMADAMLDQAEPVDPLDAARAAELGERDEQLRRAAERLNAYTAGIPGSGT